MFGIAHIDKRRMQTLGGVLWALLLSVHHSSLAPPPRDEESARKCGFNSAASSSDASPRLRPPALNARLRIRAPAVGRGGKSPWSSVKRLQMQQPTMTTKTSVASRNTRLDQCERMPVPSPAGALRDHAIDTDSAAHYTTAGCGRDQQRKAGQRLLERADRRVSEGDETPRNRTRNSSRDEKDNR